jgi:hypothetical protein
METQHEVWQDETRDAEGSGSKASSLF